jgi:hypothetical protein
LDPEAAKSPLAYFNTSPAVVARHPRAHIRPREPSVDQDWSNIAWDRERDDKFPKRRRTALARLAVVDER